MMRHAIVLFFALLLASQSWARGIHPAFMPKDGLGTDMPGTLDGASDDKTCGQCHDTSFIRANDTHRKHGREISCFTCHVQGAAEAPKPGDFDENGRYTGQVSPPDCRVCGKCHGKVHPDKEFIEFQPELLRGKEEGPYGRTLLTGEVFSPQILQFSHLNLKDKYELERSWDVHAERGLHCRTCHFPSNHPARVDLEPRSGPSHLLRDPRTPGLGEFLKRPDHVFAVARCESCHDTETAHKDLPYPRRHLDALSCQACHVPELRGPAIEFADWTVVTPAGGPRMGFRGTDRGREPDVPNTWYLEGYRPALLQDGNGKLSPYNLVTTWKWVDGDEASAVPNELLKKAYTDGNGSYRPEIIELFDSNRDGRLVEGELVLDSEAKTRAIAGKLRELGVGAPRIVGKIEAHRVSHGVMSGKWIRDDCMDCHSPTSRFAQGIELAELPFPGGITPEPTGKSALLLGARGLEKTNSGLVLAGAEPEGHYVMGYSSRPWSDSLGFLIFLLSAIGVAVHGGIRFFFSRRLGHRTATEHGARVYMYAAYERIWHWTMALSIIVLLITGFEIHFQDLGLFDEMETAVFVHNFFAGLLLLNAFLGMFYHLTTGEIRQFIPSGAGLLERLYRQAIFYGKGIFEGASHPFAKTRTSKLNPLQQFTYFGLLNVLFPFQVVTGILLWVAGTVPEGSASYGGLSYVAPLHNLGSWMFLAFLVVHVYLTTTGHTLTSNIKAMITGWEEVGAETATDDDGKEGGAS